MNRQEFLIKIILVVRGDHLFAHVRACAVVVVDRYLARTLHCIFGPQQNKFMWVGRVGLSL